LSLSTGKILVVDDDDSIRTMIMHILRREKFQVECARDGFEAIEKLAKDDYTTILLDLMMPRVDGLQVLRFLEHQRKAPKPWVIVMTANLNIAPETEGAKPLFSILAKPFDIQELINQVRLCGMLEPPKRAA
jgi:two-component system response regulator ResD